VASEKQIDANRLNGEQSTGPQSDAGKAASSKNSVKHGLLSRDVLLPDEDAEAFNELGESLRAELNPQGALESVLVERIIGLNWRLRRLGKIEADIFDCQRYGIRVERAERKAAKIRSRRLPLDDPTDVFMMLSAHSEINALVEQRQKVEANLIQAIRDAGLEQQLSNALCPPDDQIEESKLPLASYGEAYLFDSVNQNALATLSRYETSMERSLYKALHELQRLQAARHGKDVPVPLALDIDVSGVEPR